MNDSEFITMIIFVAAMLIYHKITGYSSGLSAFDIMMFLFGMPIITITTDTILGIYEYRRKKTAKKNMIKISKICRIKFHKKIAC